jgi:hypothetical protein
MTPRWLIIWGSISLLITLARVSELLDSNFDNQSAMGLHSISVTLRLTAPGANWKGPCTGGNIVHTGVPFTVLNDDRTPLASAPLQGGVANQPDECEFVFTVTEVPDAEGYFFTIAGQESRVPYPYGYLADQLDWHIEASVTEHSPPTSPAPGTASTSG